MPLPAGPCLSFLRCGVCTPPSLLALWTLPVFGGLSSCDQRPSPPPPLPVGNQQTGRCEWTVKLYSAACRLPGGRYALLSRMPPAPRVPHSSSLSLCSRSRSAAVRPVIALVAIAVVMFALILSPFPREDMEGKSLLASGPICCKGHGPIPTRPEKEGT